MGNTIENVSKPYIFHGGNLYKKISPADIELPPVKVLPKYTTLIGPNGLFSIFEDLPVIDIGDIIHTTGDDFIKGGMLQLFVSHFADHETPIIITVKDEDTPLMISSHNVALTKRNDDELRRYKGYTCRGFLLSYSGDPCPRIERLDESITILDIPSFIDVDTLSRVTKEVDVVIHSDNVIYLSSNTTLVVVKGKFKVYIEYDESTELYSLKHKGIDNPILVEASLLLWRHTRDRESLLSQLKPYIVE